MTRILARLTQTLVTLLGASVLVWALLPLVPGDPALRLLQARGVNEPRPAEVEALRAELRLDRPLAAQYLHWLGRAVRGDLSDSYLSGRPVADELARRLPATLRLAGVALLLAAVAAVAGGMLAAAYEGGWPDRAVRFLTQVAAATPSFVLGLIALHVLTVGLGWGSVISRGSLGEVWLPALCLAAWRAANWSQLLRAGLAEAMRARYTLVATARGASRWRVLWRYALPNAALPLLTAVGVGVGAVLGWAPIVEVVFSWPGIGSYVVAAITARDLPVVQGFVLVNTLAYVSASLLADLAASLLDPRLRAARREGAG